MPGHLSASQLSLYLSCGLAWSFRYVDGIAVPINGPIVRGKALDEIANLHYRDKARGGLGLSLDEFTDGAGQNHDSVVENEEVTLDVSADESKAMVRRAAAAYWKAIGSKLKPRSLQDVQRRWVVPLGDFEVVGYTDLIITSGAVVDTKYRGRLAGGDRIDRDVQLSTYSWLAGAEQLALAVATPEGKAQLMWTSRTPADVERVKRLFTRAWAAIQNGVAVPAEPTSWRCTPAYCDFWDRCEVGGG